MRSILWRPPAVLLLLLAASVPAAGGEVTAPKKLRLTLAGAVERALAGAERVRAAGAGLARAGAAVTEAASEGWPRLSADAGFTRTKRELTAADKAFQQLAGSFAGGSDLAPQRYANLYTAGLELTQPLFTGGRVRNSVRAARAGRDLAGEELRAARLATIAATVRAYYALLLAEEVYRVRRSSYGLARKHYREMVVREKAKAASRFEVLRAKVAMQNQEARTINDELGMRQARVRLLREVGAPLGAAVELATPFERPGELPALEASLARAAARRSEIAQVRHAVRAQKYALRSARSGYYPAVSARARWGGQVDDDPFADDNFDESGLVGLELRWSPFDGLLTRSRVAGARAELTRLRWQRRGLERDVAAEVHGAFLALASARKFIEAQGANVAEAAEALRLAGVRHKAGAATELDVQDARTQLEAARLNYARSLYQHSVARLDLHAASGTLDAVKWPGAEQNGRKR